MDVTKIGDVVAKVLVEVGPASADVGHVDHAGVVQPIIEDEVPVVVAVEEPTGEFVHVQGVGVGDAEEVDDRFVSVFYLEGSFAPFFRCDADRSSVTLDVGSAGRIDAVGSLDITNLHFGGSFFASAVSPEGVHVIANNLKIHGVPNIMANTVDAIPTHVKEVELTSAREGGVKTNFGEIELGYARTEPNIEALHGNVSKQLAHNQQSSLMVRS